MVFLLKPFKINLILLSILLLVNIQVGQASSIYKTYSKSRFSQMKKKLDQKGKTYLTNSKKIKKDVYYIFIGPFSNKRILRRTLIKLKRYKISYKKVKKGRYLYLGWYPDYNQVNLLKAKISNYSLSPIRIIKKKKVITHFKISLKDSSNVIVLSAPPEEKAPAEVPAVSEDYLKGDLIFSSQHFSKNQEALSRAFAKSSYQVPPSNSQWELSLGITADVSTTDMENFSSNIIEPHRTYLKLNWGLASFTLGYQILSWGRVFENSIIDRFNRQNLQFGPHLNLIEKSLSQPAARLTLYMGANTSLDFIYTSNFHTSSLADEGDYWSPINIQDKRMLGVPSDPILEELISEGTYDEEKYKKNAYGVRLMSELLQAEFGLTAIKSPQLTPYYEVDQETIGRISLGQSVEEAINASASGSTFTQRYPQQTLYALDFSYDFSGTIYRLEVGRKDNTPVTSTKFEYQLHPSVVWNLSAETYPRNGRDTFNLMLSGKEIQVNPDEVLNDTSTQYFATRYLIKFFQDTFEFELRMRFGLHENDIQILPEISYLPADNNKLTLSLAHFEGKEKSFGGFYEQYDHISLRWKRSF